MARIEYQFNIKNDIRVAEVSTPGYEEFAHWLTGDVQCSEIFYKIYRKAINNIKSGLKDIEEVNGNGMLLTITKGGAIVQCDLAFDTDPEINSDDYPASKIMDIITLERMLDEWILFCRKNT